MQIKCPLCAQMVPVRDMMGHGRFSHGGEQITEGDFMMLILSEVAAQVSKRLDRIERTLKEENL